jgi:penicillin-binding protein 2
MRSASPARFDRERRFGVLLTVALVGFALIVLGLLRLQVAEHERYLELSEENRIRFEVLRAPRGAIYDRNGVLLADTYPSFNIVFRPMPAESTTRVSAAVRSDWLRRVSELVESDSTMVHQLVRMANRTGKTAVLRRNAPFSILAAAEENRADLPGLEVAVEPLRRYPNGTVAAHLLGYAGEINDRELATRASQGYRSGALIGRSGLERSYEDALRGQDGAEYVVVNAMGKRVSTLTDVAPRPPVAGSQLVLTLDMHVQQALEDAMANVARGAAVAIDPRDGGILGMLSRPSFDPNEFSRGITAARWKEMTSGGSNPLLNRAIQGLYPPGSTFKIVTMAAALKSGVARAETRYAPCNGSYQFGGRTFGCWRHAGHGSLDMIGAIQNSCDVYFYQMGVKVGLPRIEAAARAFGLGDRTGVDMPQESKGFVPSVAWYDKRWGDGRWPKGVLLNLAIGQGEILVTPMQLAVMAAEVANGGHSVRPHLVQGVGEDTHRAPANPTQAGFDADADVWETIHTGLERVVDSGTATGAKVPGIAVAGKTGTAQNPHGQDHALFVCYAPADHPTIAIAVVAENSGHGGSVCAPIAGRVLAKLFSPQIPAAVTAAHVDTSEAVSGD